MNRKVSLCLTTENDRQLQRKKSIIIGLSLSHGLEITKVTQGPTNADEIKPSDDNPDELTNKNILSNYVGIIEDEQLEKLKETLEEKNLLIPVSDIEYYRDENNKSRDENFIIGKGNYGTVFVGIYKKTTVAIKKFNIPDNFVNDVFYNEIANLLLTRDESVKNVLPIIGVCFEERLIVMPFIYNNLNSYMTSINFNLPTKFAAQISLEIAKAIDSIHSLKPKLIHADLSLSNILYQFSPDHQKFSIYLCDFGLASQDNTIPFNFRQFLSSKMFYFAPEMRTNHPYDHKVDIFALGTVMYELFTGKLLEQGHSQVPPLPKTKLNDIKKKEIRNLIFSCWELRPEKRPSAHHICKQLTQFIKHQHH